MTCGRRIGKTTDSLVVAQVILRLIAMGLSKHVKIVIRMVPESTYAIRFMIGPRVIDSNKVAGHCERGRPERMYQSAL